MNILAIFLSVLLAAPVWAQSDEASAPEVPVSTMPASTLAPLIITAPFLTPEQTKHLKETRAVGGFAAVSGLGVILYSVAIAAAGPIAWASCLLFVGGLTAYMAHRRLHGHNDFGTGQQPPTSQAPAAPTTQPAPTAQAAQNTPAPLPQEPPQTAPQ